VAGKNVRKTHCRHGHEFDGANTRYDRTGSRQCKECSRIRQRGYYARNRARNFRGNRRSVTRS
jgi:hypothetical protein